MLLLQPSHGELLGGERRNYSCTAHCHATAAP